MAEVAILGLLKKLPYSTLMQKLGSLAIDEAKYLLALNTELDSLQRKLRLISPYLKEADAKSHKSQLTKEWVRQLRVLAFEAEDAIDSFVYKMGQKVFTKPVDAHMLRGRIEVINKRLNELFQDKENFGIETSVEGEASAAQARRLEALDDVDYRPLDVGVVGFQSKAEALTMLLISEDRCRPFRVFSITGMTGVGKTTLANKIYDRNDVQKHFVCRAFVYKTTKKEVKDVLIEIMVQVMLVNEAEIKDLASKDIPNLKARLSNFLKEEKKKNYLFVLDDVQSTANWENLKGILPLPCDGQQFSVLLTTCDESVGLRAVQTSEHNYKLDPLDEGNSQLLFSKVFFREDDEAAKRCFDLLNERMNGVPKEMVRKCEGLPLAIVLLGSLLLGKKGRLITPAEWQKVHDCLDSDLQSSNNEKAFAVCAASYFELSYCLKICLLYFGFFPEATEIQRERLIRLWMAEGFMEPQHELTMEQEEGSEWLETLMQRNLIRVAKWKSNGVPESFIIHDFLLKFVISQAKEGNFLNIPTSRDSLQGYRRVAIHHKCSEDSMARAPPSSSSNPLLRSLLSFNEMSPSLCGRFNLLNVLDLEGAPGMEKLPKEIGKLILLKYLSLCGTNLKTLPRWVGKLCNLQTLNLYKTSIESVPIEILELEKLRHLLCFNSELRTSNDFIVRSPLSVRGPGNPPRRIHRLRDLQTLWFHTSGWIENDFGTLTNLRELGLIGLAGVMEKFRQTLHQALVQLERLEILYLEEQAQEQDLPKKGNEKQKGKGEQEQQSSLGVGEIILPSLSGHKYLYDITFIGGGGIRKLPVKFPPSLTRLRLANIRLQQDMMVTLEQLPHLRDLILDRHSYDGVVMTCSAGGFPELENLTLIWFEKLMLWRVEEGAMPKLRTLEINSLFALKGIPNGLTHITTLQKLSLSMPKAFLERVKEGGADWKKIKDVPSMKDREDKSQNITEVEPPPEVSERLAEIDRSSYDELRRSLYREYRADLPQSISGWTTSTSASHLESKGKDTLSPPDSNKPIKADVSGIEIWAESDS